MGEPTITIRDVYDTQQRTDGKVDALGIQLGAFTGEVRARLDYGQTQLNDHETRLRGLEMFRWKTAGARIAISTVVSILMGGASGWLVLLLTHR